MSLKPNTTVPLWRALLYNIAVAAWTAIIGLAYAPGAIFSKRVADAITPPWTAGTLFLAKHICGQTYEIRGEENIIFQHMIIASKHQSALEIIVLLNKFPAARFIIKKELLWIPIFGQYLWRMGMVPVKRQKRGKVLDAMVTAARTLAHQRRPIIIFPEGTRTKAGEETKKYAPGMGVIYDQLKMPILPLAVNTGYYWPKKRTEKKAGTAVLEFLPVIPAGLPLRESLTRVRDAIETASTRLYEEAKATPTQKENT